MSLQLLIVDDDTTIKILHKAIVIRSNLSLTPLTFSDGKEVLDYLNESAKEEDNYLILLDINMPVMSGWEFLKEIQTATYANRLYVIMVTSSVDSGDKVKSETFPQVIGYFEKPLRVDSCNNIKLIPGIEKYYS